MCNFCPLPSVETHVRASYCLNISYIIFNILPEFYSTPLEDRFRNLGTKIKTWTGNAFPAKNSSLLHTEEMVPWIQVGGGDKFHAVNRISNAAWQLDCGTITTMPGWWFVAGFTGPIPPPATFLGRPRVEYMDSCTVSPSYCLPCHHHTPHPATSPN